MMELTKVNKDINLAILYLQEAAKQNHPYALYNLGLIYQKGDGVNIDFEKAFIYLHKSAELGFSYAQMSVGLMYYRGEGINKNIELAINYLQLAANQNIEEAKSMLISIKNYEVLQKNNLN